MHFFPMFRNGVKWHKCHIPSNTIRCPAFPYVHIFGLLRIPLFVLRTKSSASMALTKKNNKKKKQQQNKTTPPKKKLKIKTTTTTTKKQKTTTKNSNKQITKRDKTQQTNVALATARAYTIYVTNVSVFLLFLFIVSSIWGKMVLKPYSGCHGFALIRLFFGGGFARSALFYGICVQWLFSENLKIQNVVCDTTF